VPFTEYGSPADLADRLSESDAAAVVLDAVDEAHVDVVGHAVAALAARSGSAPLFALGSGGLSAGLAAAWTPAHGPAAADTADIGGPVLAVSGSRSPQTRRQVDAAAAAGWHVQPLDLEDPVRQSRRIGDVLAGGRSVALTSDDAAGVTTLERIAAAAASIVSAAVRAGATRRIIVCGGDTSSRVTRLLGVQSLSIAANPWGNVVVLAAHAADPAIDGVQLLLKGGQVGDVDLFERVRRR
jgi:uncharacterized protein YgbK (DUF1537 family)